MNKIIEEYKLERVSLVKWENDDYVLELKPTEITRELLVVSCILVMPYLYPEYKDKVKGFSKEDLAIVESTKEFVLVKFPKKLRNII